MTRTITPKVSIAIPLYNGESHIGETIESVLTQTFQDYELIICDDQSTDRSAEIAQSFNDPRIRYKLNSARLGFFGNWNRCLEVMTAPYCKLLPHDDTLKPTCLEKQVKILDEYPEVALVHCARKIIDPNGKVIATRGPGESTGIKSTKESLQRIVRSGTNPIGEPAAVLFRQSAKTQIDGFWNVDMYAIDIEYWTRLLTQGKRFYIDEVLCAFRVWPDSASVRLFGSQSRSMRVFFQILRQRFPETIRPGDVVIGNLKSIALEIARGGFYSVMKLRKK
ncbi:MAG: glycosyltransferase family 2 protein [Pontiellaceae bacterium]|nr:glycosyltransferase family 2 protein [Pontiellaceae bacterium]